MRSLPIVLMLPLGSLLLACPRTPPVADETETGGKTESGDGDPGDGDGDGDPGDGDGDGDGDGELEPIALQGAVQKGPLIVGSSIQVSPVDVLGQPTGENFATQTINDRGEFSLAAIPQGYVFIEGSGYFYNEVLGTISTATLTLRAYHHHTPENDVVVLNLLTQLASNRVVSLLGQGVDADVAVMQSETELRDALGIGVPSGVVGPMIELDLMGEAEFGNAYLLAVSAVFIQAAVTEAGPNGPVDGQLQQLINSITLDFGSDGQLPAPTVSKLRQAETDLDPALVEANLATRAMELGVMGQLPDIDVALDQDHDTVANIDDNCRLTSNVDQSDVDNDTIGDVCDNCPTDINPEQSDGDDDDLGDACDTSCLSDDDCTDFNGECTAGACGDDGICDVVPDNGGAPCDVENLCQLNKHCANGICGGGDPPDECYEVSDGCNIGLCDPQTGSCTPAPVFDGAQCDDQDPCTSASECVSGVCGHPNDAGYVLFEDFSGDAPGWTFGSDWQIGPAVVSNCSEGDFVCTNDPAFDHTPTDDNRLAGVLIGGCNANANHGDYCLTSPVVDVSSLPTVWLTYWRTSSIPPGDLISTIQVFDGNSWITNWTQDNICYNNGAWTEFGRDLTAYKNPNFQVRFCYRTILNSSYIDRLGNWSLDDVTIGTTQCTPDP
jgi:hypothetical protein